MDFQREIHEAAIAARNADLGLHNDGPTADDLIEDPPFVVAARRAEGRRLLGNAVQDFMSGIDTSGPEDIPF